MRTRRLRIHLVTDEPVDALAVTAVKALDPIWCVLEQATNGTDLRITPEELAAVTLDFMVTVIRMGDWSRRITP